MLSILTLNTGSSTLWNEGWDRNDSAIYDAPHEKELQDLPSRRAVSLSCVLPNPSNILCKRPISSGPLRCWWLPVQH